MLPGIKSSGINVEPGTNTWWLGHISDNADMDLVLTLLARVCSGELLHIPGSLGQDFIGAAEGCMNLGIW